MRLFRAEDIKEDEFERLFEEYFEQIKRFVYYKSGDEDLASDISQEVFLKIWEKRRGVKRETIYALLYTTAEHLLINKWRKEKVALKFRQRTLQTTTNNDMSPEDEYAYQQTKATYEKVLSEMSEKQREVFLMSRIDEMKYSEIASSLQISVKAVEKRMSKALELLRNELIR